MSRESHEISERNFWTMFDHKEPDYPQTHRTVDFKKLAWWREHHA